MILTTTIRNCLLEKICELLLILTHVCVGGRCGAGQRRERELELHLQLAGLAQGVDGTQPRRSEPIKSIQVSLHPKEFQIEIVNQIA